MSATGVSVEVESRAGPKREGSGGTATSSSRTKGGGTEEDQKSEHGDRLNEQWA